MAGNSFSIIVPAAGCGTRSGLKRNKILAPLNGHPVLWWTLRALLDAAALPKNGRLREVLIAARRAEWDEVRAAIPFQNTKANGANIVRLVEGGASRQQSVANAARVAGGDFLLVHDAARPLLSAEVMRRVCEAAHESGAAIAALLCADTVKCAHEQNEKPAIAQTLDRSVLWLAQTPQVFARELLCAALEAAERDDFLGTDCASLVEKYAPDTQQILLVEGDTLNFKVTYAADLARAAVLLCHSQPPSL